METVVFILFCFVLKNTGPQKGGYKETFTVSRTSCESQLSWKPDVIIAINMIF